jgi:hypothetical protein
MSFPWHKRSIVRWEDGLRQGAKHVAPSPPSHRLDESQPVIPWRVALQQSPPPLHRPVTSPRQPAATVNLHPQRGGGIFDRRNAEFSGSSAHLVKIGKRNVKLHVRRRGKVRASRNLFRISASLSRFLQNGQYHQMCGRANFQTALSLRRRREDFAGGWWRPTAGFCARLLFAIVRLRRVIFCKAKRKAAVPPRCENPVPSTTSGKAPGHSVLGISGLNGTWATRRWLGKGRRTVGVAKPGGLPPFRRVRERMGHPFFMGRSRVGHQPWTSAHRSSTS